MKLQTGLSRAQAAEYVERFSSARVCVVGDVMLDRYFWGRVDRISPEAPVPVVKVNRRSERLGGAANVAANLRELGVEVTLAGIVGDDRTGDQLRAALTRREIATDGLIIEPGRETTEKVRIIAQSQQVVRADFETNASLHEASQQRLLRTARGEHDAVIISDYGKGLIQQSYLGELIASCRERSVPVLVDPHVRHLRWYKGASIATPNTKEAASYYGDTVGRDELFETLGFRMREELGLDALLITRGEEGMALFHDGAQRVDIPTVATEVYDVTGAGDTVISMLGAALASGVPILDAVVLANQAAGETVKEIGTATVSPSRLLAAFPS